MPTFDKFIAAGVDLGFVGFVDADGDLLGSTTTAPSAGDRTGSPMMRVRGIQSITGGVPESEDVPIEGDNGSLGAFQFDSIDPTALQMSKGQFDLTLTGKFQGTTPQTPGGSLTIGAVRPKPLEYPDFAWVLQSDAKKQEGAVQGKSGWVGWHLPVTTVKPMYRNGYQSRGAAADRLNILLNPSVKTAYGASLRADVDGHELLDAYDFSSDYPRTMHRHTGNATETTFYTTYKPINVAETLVWVNGYAVVVNSVMTTLPYGFVLSAAPASGAKIISFYSFQR